MLIERMENYWKITHIADYRASDEPVVNLFQHEWSDHSCSGLRLKRGLLTVTYKLLAGQRLEY